MITACNDISRSNVDNGTSNSLSGVNDNVVVLSHLELVELLQPGAGTVENTLIDGIGYGVVNELCEQKTVLALLEDLGSVGWEGKSVANVGVSIQNSVDVSRKLGSFVLFDSVY